VATDVAARGLDVPAVDFVVHHSLPVAAETFLHRCGRTARGAGVRGLALALVGAGDQKAYTRIMGVLKIPQGLPELPALVARGASARAGSGAGGDARSVVARVSLARKVVAEQLLIERQQAQQQWLATAASAAEVELDDHMVAHVSADHADMEVAMVRAQDKALAKSSRAKSRRLDDGAGDAVSGDAGDRRGAPPAPAEGGASAAVFRNDNVDEDERAEASARIRQRLARLAEMRRSLDMLLAPARSGVPKQGAVGASLARLADGSRAVGGGGAARFASANPLLQAPGSHALHPFQERLRIADASGDAPVGAAGAAQQLSGSALVAPRIELAAGGGLGFGAVQRPVLSGARFAHVPGVNSRVKARAQGGKGGRGGSARKVRGEIGVRSGRGDARR
jgi:ATP-dependent RNA helicase DDX24/MAK5